MTTPRTHPDKYEAKHYAAMSHAYHEGETTLFFLSKRAATSHRSLLYSIRQCVLNEPDWNPELTKIVKEILFKVEGSKLIIQRKQHDDTQTSLSHVD